MNRTEPKTAETPGGPQRRRERSFLRRKRRPGDELYREAVEVLNRRPAGDALVWISSHLKPEAARMLETCLSAYGPAEALRWIAYWEEKGEPIALAQKEAMEGGYFPN